MECSCQIYVYGSVNIDLFTENKKIILVWTSVLKGFMDLPDWFQKRVCKAFDPALVDFLKPLVHHGKVVILSYSKQKLF